MLLVNDDEDGLYLLERAVKHEFPAAITIACRNGLEALGLLASQPVDAVVTDNRMPALSGIELARAIRAAKFQIPIVMLTGSDEKKREALTAGVDVFISGGDWSEIRQIIRQAIEAGRSSGGAADPRA